MVNIVAEDLTPCANYSFRTLDLRVSAMSTGLAVAALEMKERQRNEKGKRRNGGQSMARTFMHVMQPPLVLFVLPAWPVHISFVQLISNKDYPIPSPLNVAVVTILQPASDGSHLRDS